MALDLEDECTRVDLHNVVVASAVGWCTQMACPMDGFCATEKNGRTEVDIMSLRTQNYCYGV